MHPQWDGISLIGPCWFSVLCNDGIMSLRDEQRGFYTSPLSREGRSGQAGVKPDRGRENSKRISQDPEPQLPPPHVQGQVSAATLMSGGFIRSNDERLP